MLYKIKGNGITCKLGKATGILYHIIWGGNKLNNGYKPCESFPCRKLKDFRASIEIYVRNYIYEEY